MSYPPPPIPYPTGGGAPRPAHLRGRVPIRIGIVLLSVGLAVLIAGIVVIATKSIGKVNDFQRVNVAQRTGTITFSKSGGYVAYYESSSINGNTTSVPLVGVTLTSPSGAPIVVDTPYGGRSDNEIKKLSYNLNSHHGLALYQFHISQTGTYQVTVTPNSGDAPDATIAFGTSIAAGTIAGGLLVALGLLLLVAGLVLLIVGLVKRSHHKKQLNAAANYGMPPQQWSPQQWQPQPWVAPPGPQQPGPQQPGPQQPGPQQPWPAPQPGPQLPWPAPQPGDQPPA